MKTIRTLGASLTGTHADLITIEARFEPRDRERTEILLTGLPDPVLRESRGRLESALEENGLAIGAGRLFLNLVPASLKKSGEILDLPLALASAAACGYFDPKLLKRALFLGELGIDGRLHAVPGGLAAALAARRAGVKTLYAPPATAGEAACLPELVVHAPRSLAQVLAHLTASAPPLPRVVAAADGAQPTPNVESLDDVRGHAEAKHALALAAAGGHGLLLVGPPGTGKSMLARRLARLLPAPSLEERLEITQVLSAAGRWPGGLAPSRPFRAPHHTTSYAGLIGGGPTVQPGEITLAHRGVLFLDELPEFRREVLEALRQPLENGSVLVSRAARQVELPARFQLVAAMNPCPCGYRGHPRVPCACPPGVIERYRRRISGPLLDRIDLVVEVPAPSVDELAGSPRADGTRDATLAGVTEVELTSAVARARTRAVSRQGAKPNAALTAGELDRFAPLDAPSRTLLDTAARKRGLSARAVQAVRRVARTLADLEPGAEALASRRVSPAHATPAERAPPARADVARSDAEPLAPVRAEHIAQALALRASLA